LGAPQLKLDLTPLEAAAQDKVKSTDSNDQVIAYSIAVSLRRIADDLGQIKNGMKFLCERWR
jgi:hypothetical protein